MGEESTCAWKVQYKEPLTGFTFEYILSFWQDDKSVSMYDLAKQRMFLKRITVPEKLDLSMMYLGANITVCSRPLTLVDYGDASTRRRFSSVRGSSVVLVKPHAYHDTGKVLQMLYDAEIPVGRLRMVRWSEEQAREFLNLASSSGSAAASASASSSSEASSLSRDHMLAIEVAGEDIIARTHEVVGPADPADARAAAPRSIRAVLGGASRAQNVVYTSPDMDTARAQVAHIFERKYASTAAYTHCAALVIRPHVIAAKGVATVLDALLAAGLEVSAVNSLTLDREAAAELLEPYKGVVPDAERWAREMASGPCIALEVRGEDVVPRLRQLAGPHDATLAKILRPGSLRGVLGADGVRNAVHVTDIDVDGPLECKYLFHVLA